MEMMKKNKFIVCFAWIMVLIVCVISSGCTSTQVQNSATGNSPTLTTPSQSASSTTVPETPVTTLIPTTSETTIISTTEIPKIDPLSVTINSAVKKTQIGKSTNKPGNIFLVLDVTIQNNDKNNDFKYTDTSFAIYDKTNKNRRTAITSQLLSGGLNNPLSSGTIPLKSKVYGQIVFGEMDSSNSYKFYISDSTGTVLTSIDNINVP